MVREERYPALTVAPHMPMKETACSLQRDPYVVLANKQHPLTKLPVVTVADLKGIPLILLDAGHVGHETIVCLCEEAGFEPTLSYVASGAGSAAKMVKKEYGCAVLMQHVAEAIDLDGIVKVPFDETVTWDVVFMSPEDYEYTQAETLFYEFMQKKYECNDMEKSETPV